jgi:regulator of PEP synthase PpsR (kinase-PPPase family)
VKHFGQTGPGTTVNKRTVFFVSDQTGITAETMGHSLMTQFDGIEFRQVTVPFIATVDKAIEAVRKIDLVGKQEGVRPIVFSTLVQEDVRNVVRGSTGLFLDFFDAFLAPLENELKTQSSHSMSRTHRMADTHSYATRIDATNFALANDDGSVLRDYERADVILVGVSRSGKTPTCLYLAMQYGIFAANYPLTEDDLESRKLPRGLEAHSRKLFGLTIKPDRLQQIRNERTAAMHRRARWHSRCGRPNPCTSVTGFHSSTRPNVPSKRSRAGFSTAPASSGACAPDNTRAHGIVEA